MDLHYCRYDVVQGLFWQYKVYAGIRSGSLERRHQTTVGSHVMRTCCGRIAVCVTNLPDVGFGRVGH